MFFQIKVNSYTLVSAKSSQSRQRAKPFPQSSELGLPQPLTHRRVCLPTPHLVPGGGAHSVAREGVGESQFRRGDIHCGTLYIYILCAKVPNSCNTYLPTYFQQFLTISLNFGKEKNPDSVWQSFRFTFTESELSSDYLANPDPSFWVTKNSMYRDTVRGFGSEAQLVKKTEAT